MNGTLQQPNGVDEMLDFLFSLGVLRLASVHAVCTQPNELAFLSLRHNIRQQRKDSLGSLPLFENLFFVPALPSIGSRHACWPRSRRSTTGRHALRQEYGALFHFFPRSVGFGPTDSCASGALTMLPSIACHSHAMPSISSNSDRPRCHNSRKKPWLSHILKYAWIELGLPKTSLGNAFHCMPVRNTYTMAEKTIRKSRGFLPPPALRLYSLPCSAWGEELAALLLTKIHWILPRILLSYASLL